MLSGLNGQRAIVAPGSGIRVADRPFSADRFTQITDLIPSAMYRGSRVDRASTNDLTLVADALDDQVMTGLRPGNGLSTTGISLTEGETHGFDAADTSFGTLDVSSLFFCTFRTTDGIPSATRSLFGKREAVGESSGFEVRIGPAEFTWIIDYATGGAFDTSILGTPDGYFDDAWHTIALWVDLATGAMKMYSDTASGTAGISISATTNTATFSIGRQRLLAAADVDIAQLTLCTGGQVEGQGGSVQAWCATIQAELVA